MARNRVALSRHSLVDYPVAELRFYFEHGSTILDRFNGFLGNSYGGFRLSRQRRRIVPEMIITGYKEFNRIHDVLNRMGAAFVDNGDGSYVVIHKDDVGYQTNGRRILKGGQMNSILAKAKSKEEQKIREIRARMRREPKVTRENLLAEIVEASLPANSGRQNSLARG